MRTMNIVCLLPSFAVAITDLGACLNLADVNFFSLLLLPIF